MITKIPACGVELIKRFEGCYLESYPDPKTKARPYTIGWGSTKKLDGSPFELGEKITQEEADALFMHQLEKSYFPPLQKIPYYADMSEEQVGALLSFAYNLGAAFYGKEDFATISRRLRNKEWDLVPDAMVLYRNPGTDVEKGLKRRRIAEGALWSKGLEKNRPVKKQIIAQKNTLLKKEPLQSSELSYNQRKEVKKGKAYQIISIVDEGVHSKVTLDYGAGVWYIYKPHWEVTSINAVEGNNFRGKILKVKYFPQRDSITSHARRMCFSSSCAMMADFLKPTAIQVAEQEDDYYLKNYVFKHGDTTDPYAQIAALQDLGIVAEFRQNLSQADIEAQINKNIPVPIGILPFGSISAPDPNNGHWICVIGWDKETGQYIVHDPFGELDLVNGGYYGSTNGSNQRYSYANLNKRWMVDKSGNYSQGKGWGIIVTDW